MNKTFEPNKTITELGIDITREFVVVCNNDSFNKGEILKLERDDNTDCPKFKKVSDGAGYYIYLSKLAYAPETFERGEQIGVSDESEEKAIRDVKETDSNKFYYTGGVTRDGQYIVEYGQYTTSYKYIAKIPESPKVEIKEYTMEQLQEKLGETFKLIK